MTLWIAYTCRINIFRNFNNRLPVKPGDLTRFSLFLPSKGLNNVSKRLKKIWIHKQKEEEATFERETIFEDVMWMEELVELRKLHIGARRMSCQWESKLVHAPDLAKVSEAVFLMEDNS